MSLKNASGEQKWIRCQEITEKTAPNPRRSFWIIPKLTRDEYLSFDVSNILTNLRNRERVLYRKGKMLGFCNGFSMIFRGVRHRDGLWRWNAQTVVAKERQHQQIEMILLKEMDITGIYLMWQQWKLGNACQTQSLKPSKSRHAGRSLVNQAFGG
uniref:Uncharacterized protein n=1 Tax=Ditylenchus dipsaci TaxID=166011 RepID=A0A915E056_9BILA